MELLRLKAEAFCELARLIEQFSFVLNPKKTFLQDDIRALTTVMLEDMRV
jgi:hypothetical protein